MTEPAKQGWTTSFRAYDVVCLRCREKFVAGSNVAKYCHICAKLVRLDQTKASDPRHNKKAFMRLLERWLCEFGEKEKDYIMKLLKA